MSVLDLVTGDLGATKSYYSRRFAWIALDGAADHRLGSLSIVCQKGKWGRPSDDIDTYGVQEDESTGYPQGVRGFYLKNDTDPDQHEVYLVVVGSDPTGLVHEECGCKAYQCKVPSKCKHLSAIEKLVEDGVL